MFSTAHCFSHQLISKSGLLWHQCTNLIFSFYFLEIFFFFKTLHAMLLGWDTWIFYLWWNTFISGILLLLLLLYKNNYYYIKIIFIMLISAILITWKKPTLYFSIEWCRVCGFQLAWNHCMCVSCLCMWFVAMCVIRVSVIETFKRHMTSCAGG